MNLVINRVTIVIVLILLLIAALAISNKSAKSIPTKTVSQPSLEVDTTALDEDLDGLINSY